MLSLVSFVYVCRCTTLLIFLTIFFLFKQKTSYELRISDWSSDVCSSDISIARGRAARRCGQRVAQPLMQVGRDPIGPVCLDRAQCVDDLADRYVPVDRAHPALFERGGEPIDMDCAQVADASHVQRVIAKPGEEQRSEEQTSELQT